ncbi:hypothetical protein [Dactylosporangium sp. CA-139066]|uniref:hypothetical protein n=1 Tax=Dactylosporangium sp. CA-139066 TaxID=3239930 RepID=UPI003D8F4B7E
MPSSQSNAGPGPYSHPLNAVYIRVPPARRTGARRKRVMIFLLHTFALAAALATGLFGLAVVILR